MTLRLAEQLDVPLRERNTLLMAAGYAPVFAERPLDDPALHAARQRMDMVLAGHEPYPALAVDRHWTMVAANSAVEPLLVGVSAALRRAPVNVLRLSLHPDGLAPRIANLGEWRTHLLARLICQTDLTADPTLADLLAELIRYPAPVQRRAAPTPCNSADAGVVVPLRLATEAGLLSFFSTPTVFGTPVDITVSELALEAFFPADAATAEILQRLAAARGT